MMHHLSVRSMSTIPQFLASISHFHAKSYMTTPSTSLSVTRALEGAKRFFGKPSFQRKIISPEMLRSFSDLISSKISFPRLRTIWRVFMEFFGLLRFNEVAALTFNDIIWTDKGFDVLIRRSKTDQHAKGSWVSIFQNEDPKICPVSLTRLYFRRLGYSSGFLMPAMSCRKPDPATPLRYSTALLDFKSLLKAVNIDPSGYGEHSGRRGGTTAAATAGASVLELMLQGRWATEEMPRLYTDNAKKVRREFAAILSRI